MIDTQELTDIKTKLAEKQQLLARYEGKEESVQKRFKELDCASFEVAQTTLASLTKELEDTEQKYTEAFEQFKATYPALLIG